MCTHVRVCVCVEISLHTRAHSLHVSLDFKKHCVHSTSPVGLCSTAPAWSLTEWCGPYSYPHSSQQDGAAHLS